MSLEPTLQSEPTLQLAPTLDPVYIFQVGDDNILSGPFPSNVGVWVYCFFYDLSEEGKVTLHWGSNILEQPAGPGVTIVRFNLLDQVPIANFLSNGAYLVYFDVVNFTNNNKQTSHSRVIEVQNSPYTLRTLPVPLFETELYHGYVINQAIAEHDIKIEIPRYEHMHEGDQWTLHLTISSPSQQVLEFITVAKGTVAVTAEPIKVVISPERQLFEFYDGVYGLFFYSIRRKGTTLDLLSRNFGTYIDTIPPGNF